MARCLVVSTQITITDIPRPPPSQTITTSQPQTPASSYPRCLRDDHSAITLSPSFCQCTWALPPILLSRLFSLGCCGWSSYWPTCRKAAIDLLCWRTVWGCRPEVVGLEAHWLSGFKVCWSSETAQRTGAFIISKVTGFSESNSGEKWTAAMAALKKTQPFCLSVIGLALKQQETRQTYCHSNT